MPALANVRHERFAQCILAGLAGQTRLEQAASTAYRKAGYLTTTPNSAEASASRLLRRVKPIIDRVKELQEQSAKRKQVTVESIVGELEEARELAKSIDQPSAMVAASGTKAKILGLSVERHEHGTPGSFEQAQSTSELAEAMIRQANPGIGSISHEMREMALGELARHADAMHAIAHSGLELTQ